MKNTAFNTTVSYYDNIFHKTDPIDVSLLEIKNDIKEGNGCKDLIEKIRASKSKKEQAKLKMKLGCVMFNGTFGERKDDGLIKHSGLLVADFDNYPDAETMQAERERLKCR